MDLIIQGLFGLANERLVVEGDADVRLAVRFGAVAPVLGTHALGVEQLVAVLGLEDERVLNQFVADVAVRTLEAALAVLRLVVAHRRPLVPQALLRQLRDAAFHLVALLVELVRQVHALVVLLHFERVLEAPLV